MYISDRERGNCLRFEYRVNPLPFTHTMLMSVKEKDK
jgi:hypothetical protein